MSRALYRPLRSFMIMVSAVICGLTPLIGTAAEPHQFYVNATSGSDDNPGTELKPWKSIDRANRHRFEAGDSLRFARETRYVGSLKLSQSGTDKAPILVTAYGKGAAPQLSNPFYAISKGRIIEIFGSHVRIENLYLHDTPTPPPDNPPVRWQDSRQHKNVTELAAIFTDVASTHVVIRNNEFVNTVIGIRVRGSHSKVLNNYLHDAGKITEQWGALAIVIVGPHNEVAYNRVENFGFYGGIYVTDGAAVELDGEDPFYNAHTIRIHHNVSTNVKGGFLEIAGKAHDVLVDHNVSDDVDKFVGASNVKNLRILNNTIIRTRLPSFPKSDFFPLGTVFWSFRKEPGDEFIVSGNIFYLDGLQRLYKSTDHPLGITPVRRHNNLYFSPNGDVPTLLGQPMTKDERVQKPAFINPEIGDFTLRPDPKMSFPASPADPDDISYFGAYPPGQPVWKAGLIPTP